MADAATRILQAVRDLAPTINERGAEIEAARRIPADLLTALSSIGCFRMLVPKSHGGEEIDLLSSMQILETLATADSAVGWTVMIGCETPQLLSLLPRRSFDTLYAEGPEVIMGGGFAPQGEARVVDGGYRVTGRWGFASGCQHCSWLLGNCIVMEDGRPRPGPVAGMPELRGMLFQAREVEILDTWKVVGMRGTGSHDITVKDIFVPEERSLDIFSGQSSMLGPLFRFPLLEFSLHIATVAVGIAQGALNEVIKFVGTKKQRLYARAPLAETPLVQYRLGYAETSLRAARALLRSEAERVWHVAVTGEAADDAALTTRILATDSWVAQTCATIVDTCYTVGGGPSIYDSSPLQRRLRDIHTLTQHASLSESTLTRNGAALVGQDITFGF